MKISYLWLKELAGPLPKPNALADIITMHSYEVEAVEKRAKDYVLDIAILPNRVSDSSSHIGVAREVGTLLKRQVKIAELKPGRSDLNVSDVLKLQVKAKRLVPKYAASVLDGVKVKQSSGKIKDRLLACGLRPINNIVDAANYILLETGNPVHAFDYDKIEGGLIEARLAKKGEKIETLDGEVYELSADDLVIADAKGPVAIAGIKGGKRAEIGPKTKRVVLEAAVFDPVSIRRTSRRLGLQTDASLRFAGGVSLRASYGIMDRLEELVAKVSGGVPRRDKLIFCRLAKNPPKILLRKERVDSLLGARISRKDIEDILCRIYAVFQKKGGESYIVTPPMHREDLLIEEDLIEEIGRVYGYDRIKPRHIFGEIRHPQKNDVYNFRNKLILGFAALGFTEVYNYVFVGRNDIEDLPIRVKLTNPVSADLAFLRSSLLPGLVKNIKENLKHRDGLRIFEIGAVFKKGDKGRFVEKIHAAGVVASKSGGENLFFEAKGNAEALLQRLGISDIWFEEVRGKKFPWPLSRFEVMHPYRAASVMAGDRIIGLVFELHPELGVKGGACVFEFLVDALFETVRSEQEFRPISKYPAVVRDISIIVLSGERVDDVLDIIENRAGSLLVDIDLFDYYEGGNIRAGAKSLAFHLIFQSKNRTLTDSEVSDIVKGIAKTLEKQGWEVRK